MEPSVQLLGKPTVRFEGDVVEPAAGKSTALLFYAAHASGWIQRDDLLYLFWPDMPEARARNNLRQLLHHISGFPWAATLEREPDRVRWHVDSDLETFRAALRDGTADAVIEAYGGPLLDGFRSGVTPEFDTWLELEREELHRAWRRQCHVEADRLLAAGQSSEAADLVARVLRHDPLDEATVRKRMVALGEAGRGTKALVEFRAFADRLKRELDLEPTPESLEIADAIQTGRKAGTAQAISVEVRADGVTAPHTARTSRLPADSTEFVGRERELAHLADLVAKRDVRLLSLVAAGGMGKTRLAIELARRLAPRFEGGAAFASFAGIDQPSQMDGVLADTLGVRSASGTQVRDQVLRHLASREMLLVLDNLEQLKEDLSLIAAIRQYTDGVRIVTTSRERLQVADEWVYDLQGLGTAEPAPTHSADAESTPGLDADASSDAVDLFLRTAQRVRGSLVTDDDLDEIVEICRRVRGMPLALVLAAGWIRVLSPSEILAELDKGLDLLVQPDVPEQDRHQSVRAVLDATWNRLRDAEQAAWARLSVTSGSFDRTAAQEIGDAGLPVLLALVNKAVVTRAGNRFDLHPLIRSYGRERAEELGVRSAARVRLAEHYLPALGRIAARFKGPELIEAFREATKDMPNIRAAWVAAAEAERPDLIADAVFAAAMYHEISGEHRELGSLASTTVAAWGGERELERRPVDQQRAIGRLLPFAENQFGSYRERLHRSLAIAKRIGDLEGQAEAHLRIVKLGTPAAREHAAVGIRWFERLGNEHGVARMERELAWRLILEGFYRDGLDMMRSAAARAARLGDPRLRLSAIDGMIPAHIMLGELDRADEILAQIHDSNHELGLWSSEMDMLGTLQWLEMERGNYPAAERYQDRRFELIEQAGGNPTGNRRFLRSGLRYREGRYDEARELAEAHLRAWSGPIGGVGAVLMLLLLGRVAVRQGRVSEARKHLRDAFEAEDRIRSPRFLLDTAVATAELLVAEDRESLAGELIAAAEADPATEIAVRVEIDRLTNAGLRPGSPDRGPDRAWVRDVLRRVYALEGAFDEDTE